MADINNFVSSNLQAAQLAAAQLGTDPAHVLGQWGLETGWGKSVIPGSNNLGNVKSTNGKGVRAVDNQLGTSSTYAAYDTPTDGAQAYADLLQNQRYRGAHGTGGNPVAFINGIVNGGYAEDQHYAGKLNAAIQTVKNSSNVPTLSDMRQQLANQVTEDYARGIDTGTIIQGLMKTKLAGADIMAALRKGTDPERILSVIGGEPLAQFKATDPGERVKAQSFTTNLAQGASNAVSDMRSGVQQLANRAIGDTAMLKHLQDQQAKAEADPARQALGDTVGGKVGSGGVKALPYIAAGLLAPEGLVPALLANGAVGAVSGALTPTTGDGQILKNMATEGALGAVGGGIGYAAGKGLAAITSKTIGGDAAATARLTEAQAQGLPTTVAGVNGPNGFWRNIAESMPQNGKVIRSQAQAEGAVAGKVAEGMGLKDYAGAIDTNMLNAARPGIKQALNDATNVKVLLPQSMKADLDALLKSGTNPLTEGIANNSVVRTAIGNLNKAIDSGLPVAGADVQGLASELKSVLYSQGTTHSEKQLASNVIDKINASLTSNMTPEQLSAFKAANDQWRNLLAVQKMVKASNDTGVVTPRQMLQAAKTGSLSNAFLKGDAPYQDLAGVASDLYGPSGGHGLGSVIGKAIGGHGLDATALIVHPSPVTLMGIGAKQIVSRLLASAATSQNPTMIRMLTGAGGKPLDPVLASVIAKALGASTAGIAGSLGD